MSAAEAEALLIATTSSFGRQHHLARKRSQPIPFSPLDSNVGGRHSFPAAALGDELPQLAADREAVIARSGGSTGFWFDAEACSRCDQHAASPPCSSRSGRSGDQWHDAMSEAGSLASTVGSASACDSLYTLAHEGRKRSRCSSCGNGPCSLEETTSFAEWNARLEGESQRRQAAEQATAELQDQRQQLRARLEAMEAAHRDELAAARQDADCARQQAQEAHAAAQAASAAAVEAVAGARAATEAEVAAARLVASMFARVTARAEAEQQLALLAQRVERLGLMTGAMGQKMPCSTEDTLQRQLVNAGVAVCCTAVGMVGAYLIVRTARS